MDHMHCALVWPNESRAGPTITEPPVRQGASRRPATGAVLRPSAPGFLRDPVPSTADGPG